MLALWQAEWIKGQLQELDPSLEIELNKIKTTGDKILLAGMSEKAAIAEKLAAHAWERGAVASVRANTDRQIIYRPKPNCRRSYPISGSTFDKKGQLQAVLNQYDLTFVRRLEEGLVLFSLPSPMSRADFFDLALQIEKNEGPTVGKAGPMLRASSQIPVMVSNQIIVQFHGNATSDQMDSVNAENLVRPLVRTPHETNHFLMRVTEGASGDALTMARIYHESILTVSAYPDFLSNTT